MQKNREDQGEEIGFATTNPGRALLPCSQQKTTQKMIYDISLIDWYKS